MCVLYQGFIFLFSIYIIIIHHFGGFVNYFAANFEKVLRAGRLGFSWNVGFELVE